jgi:hypothetical protein
MQNIVPSQALSRRSRNLLYGAVAVLLLGIVGVAIGAFLAGIPLVVPSNPNYETYRTGYTVSFVVGVVLCVLAGIMALRAVTWRQDNTLAISTGEAFAQFLDKRYVFIRNVSKRSIGYVDAVLVGTPGVLVCRICEKEGVFYNEANKWMTQKDKGAWATTAWSPTDEAIADIKKVRDFLSTKGHANMPVFGAVIFTHQPPHTVVTTANPTVPVAQIHELQEKLSDNYFAKQDRLDITTVTQLAKLIYE